LTLSTDLHVTVTAYLGAVGYNSDTLCTLQSTSPSRQSVKLFLQSLELGLPQPLTLTRVCLPPFGSGGRGTLAGERGGGRVPFPTRGHTLHVVFFICMYFVVYVLVRTYVYVLITKKPSPSPHTNQPTQPA
jgi:hypothetical protein